MQEQRHQAHQSIDAMGDIHPIVAVDNTRPMRVSRHRPPRPLVALAVLVLGGASAWAQRSRLPEGAGAVPPRFAPQQSRDGGFTICKVMYRSVTREPNGMGWSTDWPYAGINLLTRLSELTKTRISRNAHGDPNHWVVRLTDDALFQCPVLTASDVGTIELSADEARRLREYLLKGGFFWVDDFWGTAAWNRWAGEIQKVLPEYPIVDVPPDHPILQTMVSIREIPQVSSINFWRRSGGDSSERGPDSPHADLRAIADDHGRIVVLMTHNTDISDSWEREGEDAEFFARFSPPGYALGVNAVLYALTH